MPAGGYVVVARDLLRLRSNYSQLGNQNSFGNFDGQLSRSGERLALAKRDFVTVTNQLGAVLTNRIEIVVSELTYVDGGRWSELADGGGSSLELIDARADTLLPSNWSASDETTKAPWTTVEVTARLEMGNGAYPANRFQIAMLGAGECLVDDIEVIPAGSTNILVNGNFDELTNSWRFFGNHRGSAIENAGAFSAPNVLHVRAPGDGDTANNSIRGNMTRAISSGTATIRAKVRWLAGWPEVLMRIRGNWIELPARMTLPPNLGTPGQANSRRVNNAGPAIYEVRHSPVLPRANQPVIVTCRVSDPDGVASPRLIFRVDPSATTSNLLMRDDGLSGDAVAGDGIYSGLISGRPAGTLIAFRIQANDDAATPATSVFPAGAPAQEGLVRWEDAIPFGTFAHYHMWSTAATEGARGSSPDLDNTFRDATLVYGDFRVIYNVGFRDKGSPYHGGSGDFAVTVPRDQKLLGIDDRVFASTGNGGDESTGMKGDVSGWIGQQLGIPYLHSHFMQLYRNGGKYRSVLYDMEQPNRYYAESWYGGGGVKDDLFKIAIWFEFDDNNSGFNPTGATLQRFLSDGQFKLSRYRWNWQIRPSTDTANDYSSVYNLAAAANNVTERVRTLPLIADMEEWMRVFAFHRIIGNWDSYSYSVGQNMYLYAPLGQRSTLLPWDIDFVLGEGEAANAVLFSASQDSVIQTLFGLPVYRRMLWRAYQDAINGPLFPANFQPQIDARRRALLKNGLNLAGTSTITSYMNARRSFISNQIVRADAPMIGITSNAGADFTSSEPTVSLTGFAPFAVATIEVNGVPFPVTWTSVTNWQINVPLGARTNLLRVSGRDLRGEPVAYAPDEITVIYDGVLPEPRDWVVLNEIHYNPADTGSEFIELHNRHPSFAFDLSGYAMSGVGYTLPAGTFIQPNGFLVLARDRARFGAAFGATIPVLGPYAGNLQRNGETLRLVRPGLTAAEDLVIDEVRYENLPPWPTLADGFGPSLQLIDPAQDNWRAGNWGATSVTDSNRATPGRANVNRALIEPYPEVWLNEVSPLNLTGPVDSRGEREPWVELYNRGPLAVDLSGLTLTDDPLQPGKWQFPAGSRIVPGEFLMVWLDGETAESTATELHASFRISSTNGLVILSRPQGASSAAMDYLRYQVSSAAQSFGSLPDGDPRRRRPLYVQTPGGANDASIPGVEVRINEWMAAGQSVLRDPADGQFEDWIELYNAGTNTVDLSGFFLSDSRAAAAFQFPQGYQIGPKAFRIIWADNEPTQNAPGRDLHVNFSLSAGGEEIALFTPDEQIIDAVSFGAHSENLSEGRYPDGGSEPLALFLQPSPGAANIARFANRPPVITSVTNTTIDEGTVFAVRVNAVDFDQPAQQVRFELVNPPSGMSIDGATGQVTWQTSEVHGPGNYLVTVRATDNGSPVRASTMSFTVFVREVNQAPVLSAVPAVTIDEGVPFILPLQATDADFPAQELSFALINPPAGVALDSQSGELSWTPAEDQGPGVYSIQVRVTDNATPNLSGNLSIAVTVRDINNPPVLSEIRSVTISEGSPYVVQVQANDPEVPSAQLSFALDAAPVGMTIDPSTGVISWVPDETAGGRDHNVVVRVSEPGGNPSATTSFVIGVRELNSAPTLEAMGDIAVVPGEVLSLTARASDPDLPQQTLSFTASGLPPGATLNPSTGVLSWTVPEDPRAGANSITVRVLDDSTPQASAERTFQLIVVAPPRVVISEIMHQPSAAGAEYIELANISQFNAVDISGWRMEGYNFTFPPNTILPPQGFVCVARGLVTFQATYGMGARAFGDATITLPPAGGILRLVRPATASRPEEIVDEVEFATSAPWPVGAAGQSLQLVDLWEDNRRVSNWSVSSGMVPGSTITIVPMTGNWRYWQGTPLDPTWMTPAFSDSAWQTGSGLFYVETGTLPAAKTTPLTIGRNVYYFRTRFNFNGNLSGARLRISTIVDDGAVIYLNGQEVYRLGMPEGPIDNTTVAARTAGDAILEGPVEVTATGLRTGENVLAVGVHQANAGSSDIVFGADIQLLTTTPVSSTPGAPNSVNRDLPAIPPVWINEVHPVNTAGATDGAGEREPWFELHNASDAAVNLGGWYLSDDHAALTKHQLPANTIIPARGYLLFWADAEVAPGELHVPFTLNAAGGRLLLSIPQDAIRIVDHVQYSAGANQSYGAVRDGNPVGRGILAQPSPGTSNGGATGSKPQLSLRREAPGIRITWSAVPGQSYTLESTLDLSGGWQSLWTGTADSTELSYTQDNPSAQKQRFYRVRVN